MWDGDKDSSLFMDLLEDSVSKSAFRTVPDA